MEDFRFADAHYLFGLLALPLLYWGLGKIGRNARERLLRFVSEANLRTLLRDHGGRSSGVKTLLFWLGLAFLVVALARPQANPSTEEMEGTSLDIYVLLDVSRSMDAEDVAPSRLKKAKREIQSLMSLLAGDRLGVIAFAGSSVIVSPLTSDYEVVKTLLQNIDTDLIRNQTTDIQKSLAVAEEAMRRGAERAGDANVRSNVFVVMSDGEDQASDPDYSVVNKIKNAGGTIFTIAFGTEAGAKIPVRNERGELMGYKRDRSTGKDVTTTVSTKSLQEIASLGGGQFYFATQDEGEVRDILNRMQGMQRSKSITMHARIYQEYFWIALAIGLALVVASFVSLRALFSMAGAKRATRSGGLALLLAALLPMPKAEAAWLSFLWDKERKASDKAANFAAAGKTDEAVDALKGLLAENPENAGLNYNVGTYYLTGKKAAEGREQLARLRSSDSSLKYRGLFNIAGSYATEQKKDEARAAYAEMIADLSAKETLSAEENSLLALAKENLARLAEPNQQPQQQQNQQNQQNQDQQNQQQNQGDGEKKEQSGEGQKSDKADEKKDQKDPKDGKEDKAGKEQDKKDESGKDSKDGKDGKEKKDKDEKAGKDPKDEKDAKSEEEKAADKKKKEEEAKAKESEGKEDQAGKETGQPKRYMQPRGFKERENLSGEDAKRLLQELKLHETNLQKKFMRKKGSEGDESNGPAKDW